LKEPVELFDRAAADQGQGTAESALQVCEGIEQPGRYDDRAGRFGDVQKGSVDIQEQCGLLRSAEPEVQQRGG
jgi:hypothetical protein